MPSFSYKGDPTPTILLKNIKILETGETVTDHLWFSKGKSWKNCEIGDKVCFDARVSEYEKGYKGNRLDVYSPLKKDYRLERPTKIIIKEKRKA